MPDDSGALPTDQPAPETDTPAPESNTAQEHPTAPDGVESRYKALQAEFTRKSQKAAELEARLAELEAQRSSQASEPDKPAGEVTRLKRALEESEWARAQGMYGPEVTTAYETFQQTLAADQSPIGWLTALEAYHDARLGPAQAQTAPTRAQAVTPRVDSNRSDVSPDSALAAKEAEARKIGGEGGLTAFIQARREARNPR